MLWMKKKSFMNKKAILTKVSRNFMNTLINKHHRMRKVPEISTTSSLGSQKEVKTWFWMQRILKF